jgi:hypothetical protein
MNLTFCIGNEEAQDEKKGSYVDGSSVLDLDHMIDATSCIPNY